MAKANRARAWILDFVRRTFSKASIYVDTTIADPKSYEPLGPYDVSTTVGGFKPMGVMAQQLARPCAMAACVPDYLRRLVHKALELIQLVELVVACNRLMPHLL